MSDKYYYLFLNGAETPYQASINYQPEGSISFGDDAGPVDWSKKYRDPSTNVLLVRAVETVPEPTITPPTAAEIEAQRKAALDSVFNLKRDDLVFSYGEYTMDGDTGNADLCTTELKNLKLVYGNYSDAISSGNDPFTEWGNSAFTLSRDNV